jgi:four helix bundle protein
VRVEGGDTFGFERVEVWHKAVEYAGTIYDVTRTFPEDERFGLTNQLRRSSVSISSNIAEGSVDFNRFIEIAYGSLLESVSELRIAQKQKFISDSDLERVYRQAEELAKTLSGLRRTIKPNVKSKPLNTKLSTLNLTQTKS